MPKTKLDNIIFIILVLLFHLDLLDEKFMYMYVCKSKSNKQTVSVVRNSQISAKIKFSYFSLLGHVTYTYRNFQLLRVKSLYWYMLHD